MKKKILATTLAIATLSLGVLSGCNFMQTTVSVTSIEFTHSEGLVDVYTITYSDGTTSELTVTNGKNGSNGENGKDVTAEDVYDTYKKIYGDELTFSEFCEKYLAIGIDDTAVATDTAALNNCLLSCAKVYTVFHEKVYDDNNKYLGVLESLHSGSSVIYKTDDEYTYFLTNYHVIYSKDAETRYGYENFTEKTWVYMYGSEYSPVRQEERPYNIVISPADTYAIECDYIGGSITYDVAVLRAKTDDVKMVNPQFKPVTVSYDFTVGEHTYAVGNPDGAGISVTEGVVSVDSDNITLALDGEKRTYRSIRTDTALTHGSSGGGLFNMRGELIGLNNAGDEEISSMNFAIPASVVTAVADGILYYNGADGKVNYTKVTRLGVTVRSENSRYELDAATGNGTIKEDVTVDKINAGELFEKSGLKVGDLITSITLNGKTTEITRRFKLTDVLLNARAGDTLVIGYKRGETEGTSPELVVRAQDTVKVD